MNQKTISSSFADFTLIDDGIVLLTFTKGGELEVSEAIDIIKITRELTNDSEHVLIYDFNKLSVYFTQEVRAMAQNRNSSIDHICARAFICYNLSNKLEVNHFIKYNKPEAPTELFSTFEKALEWSQSQKSTNINKPH
jgi:hypothetical protein